MKRYVLLLSLLSLLFTPDTEAQPYQSLFGTDSTKWLFRWSNMNLDADEYYYYQKDTVVNDTVYKKVALGGSFEDTYAALFREDTLSGKVWFRPLAPSWILDTIEYLTFDFSLNVGDTFDIYNIATSTANPLYATVDSIRYRDGLKYIYFNREYAYSGDPGPWASPVVIPEPFTMIEGIGSNVGPCWKSHSWEMETMALQYLMCSYKNGVQTSYKNLRYAGLCPQAGSGIEEETSKSTATKIYPNPASDYCTISGTIDKEVLSIIIYDQTGRKVKELGQAAATAPIDIRSLPDGLYYLKLLYKNEVTDHQKLIIQH